MDIYRHKNEGLVVFWGECQVRTATGRWANAVSYRKLKVSKEAEEAIGTKGFKGNATLQANTYVVPKSYWQKRVKRVGEVHEEKLAGSEQ